MGSGTPIAQGTPATPQSVPDTTFDAFNPPSSSFTGSDPSLLQQFNLPAGSFIPGSSPLADLRRRRESGDSNQGRSKIVQLENLSFQERLARSQAGGGPLFNRVALVPLPSDSGDLSPEQPTFEPQVGQGQAGGISSPPPSSFDGLAGIRNPEPGDIDFTGDSGLSPEAFAEQENFFNNLTLDDLRIPSELQIVPQGLPSLSNITRQVEEFERQGPPPPPPALSSNAAEAQRQLSAANILQALEAQTPGSVSKEKLGFASQVLKENFDRKRGDTTFDAFNPSSLGSGVQVADASKFSNLLSDVGQAIKKGFTAAVTPGSSDFLRLQNNNPNSQASPTNRIPGVSFTGQGDSRFGRGTPVERQVPLSQNEIEQAVQARNRGVSKPFVTNQQIIRNLGSPVTGKGGEPPRRSVFDVLFNSDPLPPVPSITVPIPLEIRDKLLDDAQGRARGGLVGLIRKGN